MMIPSIYNFSIPLQNGNFLIYNSRTGAIIQLKGSDAENLSNLLLSQDNEFPINNITDSLLSQLITGEYLVDKKLDELYLIKQRYEHARKHAPVIFTITTTMNCNLNCYYCYETRSNYQLELSDIPNIIDLAKKIFPCSKKKLHIDWYGGEPLLNKNFFTTCSYALQNFCQHNGLRYTASMVSNGTINWPDDIAHFIKEHKLNYIQITFDGMSKNHNKRRKCSEDSTGTFDKIVQLVDKLVSYVKVAIRYNLDSGNIEDLENFIDFIKTKGWLTAIYPIDFYTAPIKCYSKKTEFLKLLEVSPQEIDKIEAKNSEKIKFQDDCEELCPQPQYSVCAALSYDSVIIGSENYLYRCGVEVGDESLSVGTLNSNSSPDILIFEKQKRTLDRWLAFDPIKIPLCSKCPFLPLCFGGCARIHLQKDEDGIKSQCSYWRNNLVKLITKKTNIFPKSFLEYKVVGSK
jgi:uncharacterized protein